MTTTTTKIDTRNIYKIVDFFGITYFEDFESSDSVLKFFTVKNIADVFGECSETQEELDEIAATVNNVFYGEKHY